MRRLAVVAAGLLAAGVLAVSTGCSGSDDAASTTTTDAMVPASEPAPVTTTAASPGGFETLPPVNSYAYDTTAGTVIARISSRVPVGPAVPLLTIYGDGRVVAGTTGGWFEGRLADGDIQLFLDEAESVGLLGDPLTLRGPDSGAEPDLTVLFDVDGTPRFHEFDLSRIERPVALRAFLQDASVYNRFGLADPFDPGAWLSCGDGGCTVLDAPASPADRPVLPHEDADSLVESALVGSP